MADSITIKLPDATELSVEKGSTVFSIIGNIGKGLQSAAIAARVNEDLVDLAYTVDEDSSLTVYTFDSPEGKDIYWHSASHLMAQAVKRLYPKAKLAIGPAIENGFYYDFDLPEQLTTESLGKIESQMNKIIEEDLDIQREVLGRDKAIDFFTSNSEDYKVELVDDIEDNSVSIYRQGEFVDMCRGPHLPRTSRIKAFKLLSVAGAYWRGDEKNTMLQRIYGIAFPDKKKLNKHLNMLEEAKKRDHRLLGRELDLFSIHEEVGPGLIHWHPMGARLRNNIENFWRSEHTKSGYDLIFTPHIGRAQLWQTSGHLDFYKENMYSPMDIDGQEYFAKPMNCPFHIMIYKTKGWSYREFPLRWAELGTVYRYERSGVLHGLLRVRGFTQDDAHLYCRQDQMPEEIDRVLAFSLHMLRAFGFEDFKVYLATRPAEKFVGDDKSWEDATKALEMSVQRAGIEYEVDEGGGAFYGPKIDIKIKDTLGRDWQCSTIQFDFNLPERFDVSYIGSDGQRHRPYMIHRALLGSLERFIGILIEHYGGKFPLWLSPVQVMLLTVGTEQDTFVCELKDKMLKQELRVETDLREETVGYKIRDAISKKVPYIGVIGAQEVEKGTVSVRKRGEKNSTGISIDTFIEQLKQEAESKS